MDYQQYSYEGPVEVFGKCATHMWTAKTFAPSEAKARSNIAYQYKKKFGILPSTPVTLPGKLTKV